MFDSRVNTWWKNVLEPGSAKALRQTDLLHLRSNEEAGVTGVE